MTLFDQFDALFDLSRDRMHSANGIGRAFVPAADLLVSDDEVTVYMDVPGLRPEDLDIQLVDDILTVKGERTHPFASEDNQAGRGRRWSRVERGYGKFQRMLQVPKGLDPERITASMVNGVLALHIPQPATRKPRKIQINVSGESVIEGIESRPSSDTSEGRELAGAAV
jgi:HSP20 family protein